ncbi:hypothetical protein CARUB_v10007501mg, partial [Capsella rubella]
PLGVDTTTLRYERGRFAQICVEVDLSEPLKGANSERYFVAYEGLSKKFSSCGLYGHLVHACPSGRIERDVGLPATSEARDMRTQPESQRVSTGSHDDGFTLVKRNSAPPVVTRKTGVVLEEVSSKPARNLREITPNRELRVSNRFAGLESDTISRDTRKVTISLDANKENEFDHNGLRKGRSEPQVKKMCFASKGDKHLNGPSNGSKGWQMGGGKALVAIGPKLNKSVSNRPARELVFGPTKSEEVVMANGKRLRVETMEMDRPG